MTTKQIAESVNKEERTIRRWVTKLADKMASVKDKMSASAPMTPADYDIEETCAIIETGLGKNAADLFRMNANAAQKHSSSRLISLRELGTDDRMDRLEAMFERMVAEIPGMIASVVKAVSPTLQLAAPITQDYFTIMAFCRNNGINIKTSEAKIIGMECRKRSVSKSREIRTVPDERYGKVNSYHVEILEEVFAEWKTA